MAAFIVGILLVCGCLALSPEIGPAEPARLKHRLSLFCCPRLVFLFGGCQWWFPSPFADQRGEEHSPGLGLYQTGDGHSWQMGPLFLLYTLAPLLSMGWRCVEGKRC